MRYQEIMKKIHITESQLSELKKRLFESEGLPVDATDAINDNNGNATAAIRKLQADNPALKNHATYTINPAGLKMEESISEEEYATDSYEYEVVKDYLESLRGTNELYSLLNKANGNSDMRNMAIKEISNAINGEADYQTIHSALMNFIKKENETLETYDERFVAENRAFTKKQIKEAKLKRLRENTIVYKKKNLK